MRSYVEHLQALLPPGDLWPRAAPARLTALLSGIAGEFSRIDGRAGDLRREADVRETSELLPDFERVLGPDPCGRDRGALSLAARQRIAHQRWTARGGQSRAYFRDLAAKLGERIEIVEYRVSDAGVLQAGGHLVENGEQFVWTVYLALVGERAFNAGEGVAGAALGRITLSDIECEIRRLAPAHTMPVFSYTLEREPLAARPAPFLVNFLTNRLQARHPGRPFHSAKATEALALTRASPAAFFDADGVLRLAPAGTARLDHDPLTGAPKGLLLERAATNLVAPSSAFDAWVKTANLTLTPDGLAAPDGTMTATLVTVEPGQATVFYRTLANGGSAAGVSFPVFVKAGSKTSLVLNLRNHTAGVNVKNATLDLVSGAVTGPDASAVRASRLRNGWWRASITADTGFAAGDQVFAYVGYTGGTLAAQETFGIWGAQVEHGTFPTSPIATTTAPATRSADQLAVQLGALLNPGAGTVLFEIEPLAMDGYPTIVEFTNADRTSIVDALLHPHLPGLMARFVSAGNSLSTSINSGQTLAERQVRGGLAFDADGLSLCLAGRPIARLSAALPPGLDRIAVFTGNGRLSGHLRLLAYYPARLADGELRLFAQSGA